MLRIPVISSIEGLGAAVRRRLQPPHASIAASLFQQKQLEIVDVPPPPAQLNGEWQLDTRQLDILDSAEIVVIDASVGAKLLLDSSGNLLSNVKWVQSTFAGVEPFFKQLDGAKRPGFTLTRAGGIMPTAMAQYVFGWVIALERKLFEAGKYQREGHYAHTELKYRSFRQLTVSILGLGDIGQGIGRLLKVAGFKVVGFKQRIADGHSFADSADCVSSDLSEVLQAADFVVNVLPSTKATRGLLQLDTLEVCRNKKLVFINVGRGDVIKETELVQALDTGILSRAVLDVFETEPLPKESALWTHPSVHLTPHVSALSLPEEVADVFVRNLELQLANKPLLYPVDWTKGY
ncbi:hypothetical protein PHYBOEH_000698 [Phytophthora boehmeriae]|uniref:D-isomer specific 2-hydroxyacid dehydrogenase NAD-binding domain-containing protein n=1 Tax=Phytophthora boehmeriae TaxID=109152 RepID=A0A8T1WZ13_9STRA|nr:hypothetical protein PHYBOEH_000698 [Phytophthora boehmeriae]